MAYPIEQELVIGIASSAFFDLFESHEVEKQSVALRPGLLAGLFCELSNLQQLEARQSREDISYRKILRIFIVTARCAPAHERVVTTLKAWGVSVDEAFFLGGWKNPAFRAF